MPSTLVLSEVGDETWGAVLEQGQVVELHVENARRPGIAGSIYKGRVSRVLPGMQSAFIDIGIEKDAFLHDITNSGSKTFQPHTSHVNSVDVHGSALGVIQPRNQLCDRALTTATNSNERDFLACLQFDGELLKDRLPRAV